MVPPPTLALWGPDLRGPLGNVPSGIPQEINSSLLNRPDRLQLLPICFLRKEDFFSIPLPASHRRRAFPDEGPTAVSSVTVNEAPRATGNLFSRWIKCLGHP